jgi:hypothetical protein
MLNEICKCDPVEGVSLHGDDLSDDKPTFNPMTQHALKGSNKQIGA